MKLFLPVMIIFFPYYLAAQNNTELEIDKPEEIDGIEYTVSVRNKRKQDVKDKGNYDRYEMTFSVSNNASCPRIVLYGGSSYSESDLSAFARIDCTNATGYRLTSKFTTVHMKPFYVPIRKEVKDEKGKTKYQYEDLQAGYIIRSGETLRDNFIIIVPEGEIPDLRVSLVNKGRFL